MGRPNGSAHRGRAGNDSQANRMTFQRDLQPERMDDPDLPSAEHEAALAGLARLNRLTCVSRPIYRCLKRYALSCQRRLRVLDVATGSGDLPIDWARRASQDGIELEITALDISEVALGFARQKAIRAGTDVRFEQRDCLTQRLPSGFDIVTCNLFIHHLDEGSIARLLAAMRAAAGLSVVVCDLERSRANLVAVWLAAQAVTRSPVVHGDAVKSVRAALTRREFTKLATATLGQPVAAHGLPPCRYLAVIEGVTETAPESLLAQTGLAGGEL